MKLLVTGFEPFGGQATNPSFEAVCRLPNVIAGAQVLKLQVPVVFGTGADTVLAAVDEHVPDLVLCVGQAGGRSCITPEFVGINCIDARIPDNAGNQPRNQRIVANGPDAFFSTVPVHAMASACVSAGIPAEVSYSAGTFCCNELLYRLLFHLAARHPKTRAGFIHVPYSTEQAATMSGAAPSMSLDDMTRGLEVMIETALIKSA